MAVLNGISKRIKCVVWDLDDTLWKGTLLEGDEVFITPEVKKVISELDNRGILQSIASKNDFALAWARLSDLELHDFFLHPQIGWTNKSDSIRLIAEKLGFGLETLAFVDDQAVERDEVSFFLPQVTTIDAAEIGTILDMSIIHTPFVTDESRIRRKLYQADIHRKQAEERFEGGREEFLATLEMSMIIRKASQEDLSRAEELTIRTNQLNTTGRTFSYAELELLRCSKDHLLLVAELSDRYGASGTIGLSLIEKKQDEWLVKLMIVSCRVVSRGAGTTMLIDILKRAKREGVRLRAEFVATDRNRMMFVTYKFNGFREVKEDGGVLLLEHDLERIHQVPRHILVRSEDVNSIIA